MFINHALTSDYEKTTNMIVKNTPHEFGQPDVGSRRGVEVAHRRVSAWLIRTVLAFVFFSPAGLMAAQPDFNDYLNPALRVRDLTGKTENHNNAQNFSGTVVEAGEGNITNQTNFSAHPVPILVQISGKVVILNPGQSLMNVEADSVIVPILHETSFAPIGSVLIVFSNGISSDVFAAPINGYAVNINNPAITNVRSPNGGAIYVTDVNFLYTREWTDQYGAGAFYGTNSTIRILPNGAGRDDKVELLYRGLGNDYNRSNGRPQRVFRPGNYSTLVKESNKFSGKFGVPLTIDDPQNRVNYVGLFAKGSSASLSFVVRGDINIESTLQARIFNNYHVIFNGEIISGSSLLRDGTSLPTSLRTAPLGGVDLRSVEVSGVSLDEGTGAVRLLFKGARAGNGPTINAEQESYRLQKVFLQALSIPNHLQYISMDTIEVGGVPRGHARVDAAFSKTDLARYAFEADEQLKYDVVTQALRVERASTTPIVQKWTDLLAESPYRNELVAARYRGVPSIRLRGFIRPDFIRAHVAGERIFLDSTSLAIERFVELVDVPIEGFGLSAGAKADLAHRLVQFRGLVKQRLDKACDEGLSELNTGVGGYAHLRSTLSAIVAAHWYKQADLTNKIYASRIDSGMLDGIESEIPFDQAGWDDKSRQLIASLTSTNTDGSFSSSTIFGGVVLGNGDIRPEDFSDGLKEDHIAILDETLAGGSVMRGSDTYYAEDPAPLHIPEYVVSDFHIEHVASGLPPQVYASHLPCTMTARVMNSGNADGAQVRLVILASPLYVRQGDAVTPPIILSDTVISTLPAFTGVDRSCVVTLPDPGLWAISVQVNPDGLNEYDKNNNIQTYAIPFVRDVLDVQVKTTAVHDVVVTTGAHLMITASSLRDTAYDLMISSATDGVLVERTIERDSTVDLLLPELTTGMHALDIVATGRVSGQRVVKQLTVYAVVDGVPSLVIQQPLPGSRVELNDTIALSVKAFDHVTGDPLANATAHMTWTTNAGTVLGTVPHLFTALPPGTTDITATLRYSDGRSGAVATVPVVMIDGLPVVTITSPVRTQAVAGIFTARAQVVDFRGLAIDPSAIRWTSDHDGYLGAGGQLSVTLSDGPHVIVAEAVDVQGRAGRSSIDVVSGSAIVNDLMSIIQPAVGQRQSGWGTPVVFSALCMRRGVPAPEASYLWTSSINGALPSGRTMQTSALAVGVHTIKVQCGNVFQTIEVVIHPQSPSARVIAPVASVQVPVGVPLGITGSGSDGAGGALGGLHWVRATPVEPRGMELFELGAENSLGVLLPIGSHLLWYGNHALQGVYDRRVIGVKGSKSGIPITAFSNGLPSTPTSQANPATPSSTSITIPLSATLTGDLIIRFYRADGSWEDFNFAHGIPSINTTLRQLALTNASPNVVWTFWVQPGEGLFVSASHIRMQYDLVDDTPPALQRVTQLQMPTGSTGQIQWDVADRSGIAFVDIRFDGVLQYAVRKDAQFHIADYLIRGTVGAAELRGLHQPNIPGRIVEVQPIAMKRVPIAVSLEAWDTMGNVSRDHFVMTPTFTQAAFDLSGAATGIPASAAAGTPHVLQGTVINRGSLAGHATLELRDGVHVVASQALVNVPPQGAVAFAMPCTLLAGSHGLVLQCVSALETVELWRGSSLALPPTPTVSGISWSGSPMVGQTIRMGATVAAPGGVASTVVTAGIGSATPRAFTLHDGNLIVTLPLTQVGSMIVNIRVTDGFGQVADVHQVVDVTSGIDYAIASMVADTSTRQVHLVVENRGDQPAPASTVQTALAALGWSASRPVPLLAARARTTVTVPFPDDVVPDLARLTAAIDPDQVVVEMSETNNSATIIIRQRPVPFFITPVSPVVAISEGGAIALGASIVDGIGPYSVTAEVGGVLVPLSGAAEGVFHGTTTITTPNILQVRYRAVDADGRVATGISGVSPYSLLADLAVDATSLQADIDEVSGAITIHATIRNAGVNPSGPTMVRFSVDDEPGIDVSFEVAGFGSSQVVGMLSLAPGFHQVTAFVDPFQRLVEAHEDDNMVTLPIVVRDQTPPTAVMPIPDVTTWTSAATMLVRWQPVADRSGIAMYEVSVADSAWVSQGLATECVVTMDRDGGIPVLVRATDRAGNVGPSGATILYHDAHSPEVPSVMREQAGLWSNEDRQWFSWVPSRDFGIQEVVYEIRVDDGVIQPIGSMPRWQAPATLTDGRHRLEVRSVDALHQASAWSEVVVWGIDRLAPQGLAVNSSSHPSVLVPSSSETMSLSWNAPMDVSGVATYHYAITRDAGTIVEVTNIEVPGDVHELVSHGLPGADGVVQPFQDGVWYVHLMAMDRAGNPSETVTRRMLVDRTRPALTVVAEAIGGRVVLSITHDEPLAGLNISGSAVVSLGQQSTQTKRWISDLVGGGTHTYTVMARDLAGLISQVTVSVTTSTNQVVTGLPTTTSGSSSAWGILGNGARCYTDRTYTYSVVPPALLGQPYLMTANADKTALGNEFLRFTIDRDAVVYVAFDERATIVPQWLSTWSKVKRPTLLTGSDIGRRLFYRRFAAGTVILGSSENSESMYGVVVVSAQLSQIDRDAPQLTLPTTLSANEGALTEWVPIVVTDGESTVESITLQASSSSPQVVSSQAITIDGTGDRRRLRFIPAAAGTTVITVTATDGLWTSSVSCTVTVLPSPSVTDLVVASDKRLLWHTLAVGAPCYSDRAYTFNRLPEFLVGQFYLRTANDDKDRVGDEVISFRLEEPADVLVAYDARSAPPAWLMEWAEDLRTVSTTDFSTDRRLFFKRCPPGVVTFGENGAASMYTIIVIPIDDDAPMNTAPTIIPSATTLEQEPGSASVQLEVLIEDHETEADALVVTAVSAQPDVLPASGMSLTGSGARRTLTWQGLHPGRSEVTITVEDGLAKRSIVVVMIVMAPPDPG